MLFPVTPKDVLTNRVFMRSIYCYLTDKIYLRIQGQLMITVHRYITDTLHNQFKGYILSVVDS